MELGAAEVPRSAADAAKWKCQNIYRPSLRSGRPSGPAEWKEQHSFVTHTHTAFVLPLAIHGGPTGSIKRIELYD